MPVLILVLISGFLIGRLFTDNPVIVFSKKLISPIVLALLFFMGVLIGANENLLSNFAQLGLNALIIVTGALVGTISLTIVFGRLLSKKQIQKEKR